MRRWMWALVILTPALQAAGPQRHQADAPLRAIQFIDRDEGWAAGDDGVIWHSIDGGAQWERQLSGVRGSLRSICFINPYTGWVVGREELPNGRGSIGIVLVTTDGGAKWTRVAQNALPGLHSVKFFDGSRGIVAGEGCDAFPSGVFATADGGKSWRMLPGPRPAGWLTADFADMRTGVLAGSWSSLGLYRDNVFAKAETDSLGGRHVHAMRLYRDTAFAAGQGGLILRSDTTAGAKWKIAQPKCLSVEALTNCDFNALHVIGEHVWVAGRPGSFVLHSSDYGKTWEKHSTGQLMPIHGMHFIDHQTGWAVGELGLILATADGGKTWAVQRRGGERAAALFVHANGTRLPLDTIAQLGGDEGYLTAALRVFSADPASAAVRRAGDAHAWAEAMRQVGGASGECLWPFALPPHLAESDARAIMAALDEMHSGRAGEMLMRQMVLAIRMWQPALVVGDANRDGVTHICEEALKHAFTQAGDPQAFPEQIEQLGLKPWSAIKLYSASVPFVGKARTLQMTNGESLPRIGDSARDLALPALALLHDGPISLPTERTFFVQQSTLADAAGHATMMQGIVLAHGGTARRAQPPITPAELTALEERGKTVTVRRNIESLANPDLKIASPEKLIAQLTGMLRQLPPDLAGQTAYAVARRFVDAGQWPLADEAFRLMVDRYPAHPLALEAHQWLIRYRCSSEARHRFETRQFIVNSEYKFQGASPEKPIKDGPVQQTSRSEAVKSEVRTPFGNSEASQWFADAVRLEEKVQAFGPVFGRDPAMQICAQSARRAAGDANASRQWCDRFLTDRAPSVRDIWRDVVAAEAWLGTRGTQAPRPLAACRRTAQRPHLDGKLDDECWTAGRPLALRTASGALAGEWTTQAFLAHDSEFLYIAVESRHPAGMQVPKVDKRTRDMDLTGFDRVSVLLDLDRDFHSAYHLQIDQRGALCEDCWGDRSWNPKWYVAVHSTETGWTAEAAIPLSELTGDAVVTGKTWACNVSRFVPGKGILAWSTPAEAQPRPEGMGLLIFADEKK